MFLFGPNCIAMVKTLFSKASAIVSINNTLTKCIPLHQSIRRGSSCSYVLSVDALGYLLESKRTQRRFHRISLQDRFKIMNDHLADNSLLSVCLDQDLAQTTRGSLNTFHCAYRSMVNERKTDYWLIRLEDPPSWIPFYGTGSILAWLLTILGFYLIFTSPLLIIESWN